MDRSFHDVPKVYTVPPRLKYNVKGILKKEKIHNTVYASEPLFRLLNIFAMGRSRHSKDWMKRLRGSATILALLALSMFVIKERSVYSYPKMAPPLLITDVVSLITLLSCAVCNILMSSFRSKSPQDKLKSIQETIDDIFRLDKTLRYTKGRRRVSNTLCLVCAPLLFLCILEAYNLSKLHDNINAALYSVNYLFHFINSLVSVHFYASMYMVSSSFFILNSQLFVILEDCLSKSLSVNKNNVILPNINDFSVMSELIFSWSEIGKLGETAIRLSKYWNFNDLMMSYVYICDQCDIFDSFFGIQNLLMALNGIIAILHSFHVVTLFGPLIKESGNWGASCILVSASCCFAIYNICILFGIAMSCELVKQESSKTSLLLDAFLYNKLLEKKDQVNMWSQLVIRRFPKFTACRFFTIDLTLLYSMAGTIATYLIILIQLK